MKRQRLGFTIVELLTVLATIVLLIGLLVPSVALVRKMAKETRQKAQFITIDQALMIFRADYGDYPRSENPNQDYCGAQRLSEALVGWDLLGFHPDSAWRTDGLDAGGGEWTYDPDKRRDINDDGILDTLNERVGPYLEVGTANAFTLRQLFGDNTGALAPDTFVLCDSFGVKTVALGGTGKTFKAGTPILYYRASTSKRTMIPFDSSDRTYDYMDNDALVSLGTVLDQTRHHLLGDSHVSYPGPYGFFTNYIRNPQVTVPGWPYRADSYILISAGADGLYGTDDDITNFGN